MSTSQEPPRQVGTDVPLPSMYDQLPSLDLSRTRRNLDDFIRSLEVQPEKNVDERSFRGYSPLMWACTYDRIEAVVALLKAGANVNHKDDCGVTPLHVACYYGHEEIVKILLMNGAEIDPFSVSGGTLINRHTPLHFACLSTAPTSSIIRMLLEAGADVNARNGKEETALHLCSQDTKKLAILLKAGAKADVVNKFGESPLHSVRSVGQVRLLLHFGASVNVCAFDGDTPLDRAASSARIDVVILLLRYWAGINVKCRRFSCWKLENKPCERSTFMCCWARNVFLGYICFERFYVLCKVGGLAFLNEPPPTTASERMDLYQEPCRLEWPYLSDRIPGSHFTYRDVLSQRESALRSPQLKKVLTIGSCKDLFKYYGSLIHTRFVTGQRKVQLMDQCTSFFTITSPKLPPECARVILAYLNIGDLINLLSACPTPTKRATQNRSKLCNNPASQKTAGSSNEAVKKGPDPIQHRSDVGEASEAPCTIPDSIQLSLQRSRTPSKSSKLCQAFRIETESSQPGVPSCPEISDNSEGEPTHKKSKITNDMVLYPK